MNTFTKTACSHQVISEYSILSNRRIWRWIVVAIISISGLSLAQSPTGGTCTTQYPTMIYDSKIPSLADPNIFNSPKPFVFEVDFMYRGLSVVTIDEAIQMVQELNLEFKVAGIFFKLGDVYERPLNGIPLNADRLTYYLNPNASGGFAPPGAPTITISYADRTNPTIYKHETGHYFGLIHVGAGADYTVGVNANCQGGYNLNHIADPGTDAENVTRDFANPNSGYNANIAGDLVHDTNAAFNLPPSCSGANGFEYVFNPNAVDNQGDPYVDIQVTNIMRNIPIANVSELPILESFTPGQFTRMRATIQTNPFLLSKVKSESILYSAYKWNDSYAQYNTNYFYPGGPWDNAIESRLTPGLTYTLQRCTNQGVGPFLSPADYPIQNFIVNVPVDELFYADTLTPSRVVHELYYSIRIHELDDQINGTYACWDPQVRISSGRIIRFKDNILNANVEIQQLSESEASDQQLEENLQPGLYAVERQLNTGQIQQNVVRKDN